MTKDDFYAASKRRDEDLSRCSTRWLCWMLVAVFLPMIAGLFLLPTNLDPAPERAVYLAGYVFVVLLIYMSWTRRLQDSINKRHGMKCAKCDNTFESEELNYLGFKNACRKCGTPPFQPITEAQ